MSSAADLPCSRFDIEFGRDGDSAWPTLTRNLDAFGRRTLLPRALTEVGHQRLITRVLGVELSLPVIVSLIGDPKPWHSDGVLAAARAAAVAGTLISLGALDIDLLEDVAAAALGRVWFELELSQPWRQVQSAIKRAEAAGHLCTRVGE